MTAPKTNKQYNGVDLIKFLCAILVVMIHIPPYDPGAGDCLAAELFQSCVTRVAVPFFFIASGFFLYRKCTYESFDWKPISAYILKILRLYLIWTVIYLPFNILRIRWDAEGVSHGVKRYLKDLLFVGSFPHLWYLVATMIGVCMVSFFLYKRCGIKTILTIAACLYAAGLLGQSWYGVISPFKFAYPGLWRLFAVLEDLFFTTRNGFMEGFLFIAIGMFFAYREINISLRKSIFGFVLSLLLMTGEYCAVTHYNLARESDMFIFLVPTAFFLFCIAGNIPSVDRGAYRALRQMGVLIYFLHLWVKEALELLCVIGISLDLQKPGVEFAIVLIVTIAASACIIRLSGNKKLKWMKALYA